MRPRRDEFVLACGLDRVEIPRQAVSTSRNALAAMGTGGASLRMRSSRWWQPDSGIGVAKHCGVIIMTPLNPISMRKLALSILSAAAIAMPAALSAQATFNAGVVDFNGDIASNGTAGGYQIGPYQATLSGFSGTGYSVLNAPNLVIWCVDFNHMANPDPDTYIATRLFGGGEDLSNTRLYNTTGFTNATALQRYRQFAYLIEQYNPSLDALAHSTSAGFAGNIQGTIWSTMGSLTVGTSTTDQFDVALTLPTGNFSLTRDWYVLSDCLDGVAGCTSNQEYLVSVASTTAPEPSTYALMVAGLAGIGAVARRRKTRTLTA